MLGKAPNSFDPRPAVPVATIDLLLASLMSLARPSLSLGSVCPKGKLGGGGGGGWEGPLSSTKNSQADIISNMVLATHMSIKHKHWQHNDKYLWKRS